MTTVYSKSHLIQIEFAPAAHGATNLTWNHQHKATVNTADLLAALDAVPREAEAQLIDEREELKDYARAAEAERDELAATIARVREATAIWGDGQFRAAVLAALDPKPAFELPTEAGVKFYAEDADGDSGIFTTLVGGTEPLYLYDDDQDYVYSGPELASWQNFRLLDGGAA